MSILNIEKGDKNSTLREISKEVVNIKSPEIKGFISDMRETLESMGDIAIGLAAPQVGRNIRIFIVSNNLNTNQKVFINPKITKTSDKKFLKDEGCLSLPHLYGKVLRYDWIKVEALNENGRIFKLKAKGLLSQLIQHEIDHLDGILFVDKAEKIENVK